MKTKSSFFSFSHCSLIVKKKKMTACSSCKCCHFSVGGIRTWSLLMALVEIGTISCHFVFKTPFTKITQVLGANPSEKEQQILWAFLAFLVVVRLSFAASPMCRKMAQFAALVHCMEVVPILYLVFTNIALRFKELEPLQIGGGASIAAFTIVNACVFYNYWMDRLTGEIRSTAVSVARADSPVMTKAARTSGGAKKKAESPLVESSVASSEDVPAAPKAKAAPRKSSASSGRKSASASPAKKKPASKARSSSAPKKRAGSASKSKKN